MLNYEEMSDFEINMRVACSIDGVRVDENGNPEYAIDCFLHSDNGISVKWLRCGNDEFEFFNPCNNPSDAWSIIMEYQISITKYEGLEKWDAHGGGICVDYDHCIVSDLDCSYSNKNPLRAAMIVFLMMSHK